MDYTLYVGSQIKVKKGRFKGSFGVMYCGMCNEDTFVLAVLISVGYQGFSPNLYFNKNARFIEVNGKEFEVLEVSAEHLVLAD